MAPKFLKFIPVEGGILVQAFIIGFGFWEMGVNGFLGFAAKRPLKAMAEHIVQIIQTAEHRWNATGYNAPPLA